MMRFVKKLDIKTEFQVAPLVDVVFLLIIFFISTASFRLEESQLKVRLPGVGISSVSASEFEDVIISIKSNGTVMVNQQEYDSPTSNDLKQLRTMLKKLSSIFPDQGVIIRADAGALHGRVVDVLNACAASGIKNISFYLELN